MEKYQINFRKKIKGRKRIIADSERVAVDLNAIKKFAECHLEQFGAEDYTIYQHGKKVA